MKAVTYDWLYEWNISSENRFTNVNLLVSLLSWCETNLDNSEWTYDVTPKLGIIFKFVNEGDMFQAKLSTISNY
jgi:hypothetical protein